METKTWKNVEFENVFVNRKKDRIIGLTFPASNKNLGLEPSILSVLPPDKECEYSMENIDFNDDDVQYYVCSVYIAGMDEFKVWAAKHDRNKIIVGGYHPTMFPEDFKNYAHKIVIGPCDSGGFWETVSPQTEWDRQMNGPNRNKQQIVNGICEHTEVPRYDLFDITFNQQIIPDKKQDDICTSINTSIGCPMKCDFCCSPIMCPKLVSKPIELVERETALLGSHKPKWLFIRDENFPMQKDWKERLKLIEKTGAKIYLFSSANYVTEESSKFMAEHNVYMICLGLENINTEYKKNKNLDKAVGYLKKYGIYTYLSFIVNPLEIIGQDEGKEYYNRLMKRFFELKPEMVTGNFLMPFRGTALWDQYYAYVSESDYKDYDSKSAFLVKNDVLRKKMEFYLFYYQWMYYTSDEYRLIRNFTCNDTLHARFEELCKEFRVKYERLWNVRA